MAKAPAPRVPQNAQHYVIWHPDRQRHGFVPKSARAFHWNGSGLTGPHVYHGPIWVDNHPSMVGQKPGFVKCCNEDPWVLSTTWLYSFCHATQLRRDASKGRSYVKRGSILFFASGDQWYGKDKLVIDTVFVVRDRHEWLPPGNLPATLSSSFIPGTKEYNRHLVYGVLGNTTPQHIGTYTYEAELQPPKLEIEPEAEQNTRYSFLPLMAREDKPGDYERLAIPSSAIQPGLQTLLSRKAYGKPPVPIGDVEAAWLYDRCRQADVIVTLARD